MVIYQVDAFTNQKFSGNPAGVCILKSPKDDLWMQNLAREMNLPETAFLLQEKDGYRLRWFTPVEEEELCGHATLASAHILWETKALAENETARFYTRSGLLTAVKNGAWIVMNFPGEPPEPADPPAGLLNGLGVTTAAHVRFVGRNRMDYIVEVAAEEIVRGMNPDFTALQKINARGVIVTSASNNPEYDFVSRFFAPGIAINEDPVTGSAHCCLGPYWRKKLNQDSLVGFQASARGGIVKVTVAADRVYLSGQAVTVFYIDFKE